jgi:hypothetical protein
VLFGPLKWYELAESVRVAVHNALTVKPLRSGVVPGAIAWDECDCGLLAVSVNQIYPSDRFPDLIQQPTGNCGAAFNVAELVIQVVRCAPNPEGQSLSPTVAELDASAREVLQDAYEMICSVLEQLQAMEDARDISAFMLRPLTAQGPSGGCVGNELRALVGLS